MTIAKAVRASFLAVVALTAMAAIPTTGSSAQAQSLRRMSCDDLWYERNRIYADNGYCFKTARARAVFGRGCFPPYGRLSPREQRQVSRIEEWEYRKGCR